jgi:hypothetical protein
MTDSPLSSYRTRVIPTALMLLVFLLLVLTFESSNTEAALGVAPSNPPCVTVN